MAAVTLVQLQPARDALGSVMPVSVPAAGRARKAALLAEKGSWKVALDKVWTQDFCSWSCLDMVLSEHDVCGC